MNHLGLHDDHALFMLTFASFLHGAEPITVRQPSLLKTIKHINHLTHRDIVERFVSWIKQIRSISQVSFDPIQMNQSGLVYFHRY
jgi:4-hydroxyphenylpyruvate dioxygenase-like putative hemolysin